MSDRSGDEASSASWSCYDSESYSYLESHQLRSPTPETKKAPRVALPDNYSSPPQEIKMTFQRSSVTMNDLEYIREKYNIPSSISLRCPDKGDKPHRPPPGEVTFYLKMFSSGVRLPLHYFPQMFLSKTCLAPAQLSPNGWNILLGCWVLWHLHGEGVELTYEIISALHYLKTVPGDNNIYYLGSRSKPLVDFSSKIRNWKSEWFFVGGEWLSYLPKQKDISPVPMSFKVPVNNQEWPTLDESVKAVMSQILSIPKSKRCTSYLLSEARLLSSGLVSAPSVRIGMPCNSLDYINDRHNQAQASSSHHVVSNAYKPIGVEEGEQCIRRGRSRSPLVRAPSATAAHVSSSRGSRIPWTAFRGPDEHGDTDPTLEDEINSISQHSRDVILEECDKIVNMDPDDLFASVIRDQFRSGARLSLAATKFSRELHCLKERHAQAELDRQEAIHMKEVAEVLVTSLKKELLIEKQISSQSALKIKELQNQLNDDAQLEEFFSKTKRFKSLLSELFNFGAEYACEGICERYPDLDLSFMKDLLERFLKEPSS